MKITNNTVVTIAYKLYAVDEERELIEETEAGEPFEFLFGHEEVLPGVEKALENLEAGAKFEINLSSDDAFGPEMEDYYHEFPISDFIVDGELDEEVLEEDAIVPMEDEDGNIIYGVVVERKLNTVIIDFNHPLAGEDICFEGEVVGVREATAEELAGSNDAFLDN